MSERFSENHLRELGYLALSKMCVREDVINPVVDGLIWTSLRGIDSHGIRLLPHYVKGVKDGRLNPNPNMVFERTAPGTGTLDADNTFGHAAGAMAMRHAIDLSKDSGIGAVSVYNSSHCGALSYFAHAAAEEDMLGLAFTHATPRVKSPGSSRAFFGNNPICLVAPMEGELPFCFDSATTSTTFNAVKAAAAAGKLLPPGLVADSLGNETTDPSKAEQLLPIGDYKGFGLSMLVDILCALLSGMPNGNNVSQMFSQKLDQKRSLGQFYCALRIDAFRDIDVFRTELADMASRVRNEPAVDADIRQVMVPGDPEKAIWEDRMHNGIPVPAHIIHEINQLLK